MVRGGGGRAFFFDSGFEDAPNSFGFFIVGAPAESVVALLFCCALTVIIVLAALVVLVAVAGLTVRRGILAVTVLVLLDATVTSLLAGTFASSGTGGGTMEPSRY